MFELESFSSINFDATGYRGISASKMDCWDGMKRVFTCKCFNIAEC